jgi:peptide/nickel transport system substrate-binding protein
VLNFLGSPETALPVFVTSVNAQSVSDMVFLPLAQIGDDLGYIGDEGFEPRLARSWTLEDSITIVFELDRRATWQDGEPVTAHDVAFTFDLYRDPVVNSPKRGNIGRITAVTARDDATVAFTFSHAYREQFFDAVYHMPVHPAHLLDTIPRAALQSHPFTRSPIGSGPYRLTRWDAGSTIELIADPDFFLGAPGINRIVVQVIPGLNTVVTRIAAGEADFTDFLGPPAFVEQVETAPTVRPLPFRSKIYMFAAFNFRDPENAATPHPLFGNPVVREALSLAIDRATMAQASMGEFGRLPFGPVSPANPFWEFDVPAVPFDTARARQLLAGDGWSDVDGDGVLDKDGQRLAFELIVPSSSGLRQQLATMMQSQLVALGVEMNIELVEFGAWQEQSQAGRFDATFHAWAEDASPATAITGSWSSHAANNWGRYASARFDSLITAAARHRDDGAAQAAWTEALRQIQQDWPAIWVIAPIQVGAVHERIQNATVRPDSWGANVWEWQIPSDRMLPRDSVGVR